MGAPSSRLTRLQSDVLAAFFQREQRFYLTGGGALAGFHLGHRETHDLDLFTLSPVMEDGVRALRDSARELVRTSPEFRRMLLTRGNESIAVDLVVAHAVQVAQEKPAHGVVRVDPVEEIFANKLCALLGRSEVRDLVDVRRWRGLGCRWRRRWPPAGARTAA